MNKENTKLFVLVTVLILIVIGVFIINSWINNKTTYKPPTRHTVKDQEISVTYTDELNIDIDKISNCVIYYADRKELVFQYGYEIDNEYDGDYIIFKSVDNANWQTYSRILYDTEVITFRNITKPTKTDNWFSGMSGLKQINNWNLLDTSNTITMNNMFSSLGVKNIDISHFDTRNVEEMDFMFFNCSKLEKIDFSGLNLERLRSYTGIFLDCSHLSNENIAGFYKQ
ncbi:MAG: BspA family leucine-rich repeat surface protein [Lachnospiraceae bacterium]|nr:BspA family leucine-rich repeat surface protein [Lachnospiraceae bacterium]